MFLALFAFMKKKIGLTLSGGGARGFAHLGLLKVLEEQKIEVDVLSGTSMGALVGAFWAKGYPAEQILEILKKFTLTSLLQLNFRKGLLNYQKVRKILERYFPENDFGALQKPFWIACTDLISVKTIYFSENELLEPLIGSITIPPLARPVIWQNYELIDGGILDNIPAQIIREKCDTLIISHCNVPLKARSKNLVQAFEQMFVAAVSKFALQAQHIADIWFEPPAMKYFRFRDFKKADEIFEVGYQHAKQIFTEK